MTRPYGGRRGAPRPPRHIEEEMEQAGAAGDDVRLGIARAKYMAWLRDQGEAVAPTAGNRMPDGAAE